MTQYNAEAMAKVIGPQASAWHTGGNVWVVLIHHDDGKVGVLSDEIGMLYNSEADFHDGEAEVFQHEFI